MKELDRKRPFGIIYGNYHASYTQDGCEFDVHGKLIGAPPEEEKPKPKAKPSLGNLPIDELKKRVADAGGTYKNRIDAITFLNDLP